MNLTQYVAFKRAGGLAGASAEAVAILDAAYVGDARAVLKGMTSVRKPFSGPVYTMPMGSATAKQGRSPEQRRARFAQQLEQAVRRGFALAGWCCNDCGGAVTEQDLTRLCRVCADEGE